MVVVTSTVDIIFTSDIALSLSFLGSFGTHPELHLYLAYGLLENRHLDSGKKPAKDALLAGTCHFYGSVRSLFPLFYIKTIYKLDSAKKESYISIKKCLLKNKIS